MKQFIVFFILAYFRFFAKLQLLKIRPIVIGITGSAGKTSARNAIFAVLKNKFKVKVSYKANSESGIPLNILGLAPKKFSVFEWFWLMVLCPVKLLTNWEKYDVYLVEMGIDSPNAPKNMQYLLTIVKPNISVFLNAAPMHSEPFDYLVSTTDLSQRSKEITKLIAEEKGLIITEIDSRQTAIINIDQEEIVELLPSVSAKLVSFGKKDNANIRIINYSVDLKGSFFTYQLHNQTIKIQLINQVLPEHFTYTFASAIAVGVALNMNLGEVKTQLENNFKLPPGRATLIEGINNSIIIDSSYNASSRPMIDMLNLLDNLPGKRKLALLGDMRELGKVAEIEHETIAKKAVDVCNKVYLIGPQMKKYAMPILEQHKIPTTWFKNAYEAAKQIKLELNPEDILLVKSSQNTLLLEIAVQRLMAHPQDANKLLARRGSFWDKKRAEIMLK